MQEKSILSGNLIATSSIQNYQELSIKCYVNSIQRWGAADICDLNSFFSFFDCELQPHVSSYRGTLSPSSDSKVVKQTSNHLLDEDDMNTSLV